MRVTILFLCIVIINLTVQAQQPVSNFQPGKIWYDTDGNPINAHAGGMLNYNNKYYWFGQIFIPGFRGSDAWVGVSCYSSTDLYNWKNLGVALAVEDHPSSMLTRGCKIERPKVIYNKKTRKFVMWWHHDINNEGHNNALTGIAVSDSVSGPYKLVRIFRPSAEVLPENLSDHLKKTPAPAYVFNTHFSGGDLPKHADSLLIFKRDLHQGQMSRDMTLLVDDDGKAYHIYASEENSTLHIAELSDDYLGYTGRYIRVFAGRFMEAPTVFKYDNRYYIVASGCTGWAPNAARSASASTMLGEWTEANNPCSGPLAKITYNAQGTFVLPMPGKKNAFIFMADRWSEKNEADARYVWLPLHVEKGQVVIDWLDSWTLDSIGKKK